MLRSLDSGIALTDPDKFIAVPEITACITGHRPGSVIPFMNNENYRGITIDCTRIFLAAYIDFAYNSGYTSFMDGLASGTDLWAAWHIINRRRHGEPYDLIGVIPFLRHSERFSPIDKIKLRQIEPECSALISTCSDPNTKYAFSGPGNDVYRRRNYFMADRSGVGIAFMNRGQRRSGTGQTIARLKSQKKFVAVFGSEDIHAVMRETGPDARAFAEYMRSFRSPFE